MKKYPFLLISSLLLLLISGCAGGYKNSLIKYYEAVGIIDEKIMLKISEFQKNTNAYLINDKTKGLIFCNETIALLNESNRELEEMSPPKGLEDIHNIMIEGIKKGKKGLRNLRRAFEEEDRDSTWEFYNAYLEDMKTYDKSRTRWKLLVEMRLKEKGVRLKPR